MVVSDQGRLATERVTVAAPARPETPVQLPKGCRAPGRGGGADDPLYFGYYIDDGILAELQHLASYSTLPMAGLVCGCLVRWHPSIFIFGSRKPRDPPLLAARKVSSGATRLEVLGWTVDTVAMTISLPNDKIYETAKDGSAVVGGETLAYL